MNHAHPGTPVPDSLKIMNTRKDWRLHWHPEIWKWYIQEHAWCRTMSVLLNETAWGTSELFLSFTPEYSLLRFDRNWSGLNAVTSDLLRPRVAPLVLVFQTPLFVRRVLCGYSRCSFCEQTDLLGHLWLFMVQTQHNLLEILSSTSLIGSISC